WPVTVVPTAWATVAIDTFMTEVSRVMRNRRADSVISAIFAALLRSLLVSVTPGRSPCPCGPVQPIRTRGGEMPRRSKPQDRRFCLPRPAGFARYARLTPAVRTDRAQEGRTDDRRSTRAHQLPGRRVPGQQDDGRGLPCPRRSRRPGIDPDPRPRLRHPGRGWLDPEHRAERPRPRPDGPQRVRGGVVGAARRQRPRGRRSRHRSGLVSRDPDLREPLGDTLHAGTAARWRRARGSRLRPAGRALGVARRDGQVIREGGQPMPGLLRGVARTAVVAGTATAVSNRVSRRQANRWTQQDEQQYAQQQYAPPQYEQAPAAAPDTVSQLKDLADLKAQGVLTDAEFEAQKAKILAS